MRIFEDQNEARRQTLLLALLFALVLGLLLGCINLALALVYRLFLHTAPFPAHFFTVNTAVVLLFVLGGWWVQTSDLAGDPESGEKLARRLGARECRPAESEGEQRLAHIVDELAIAGGLPAPRPMVLPREDAINAVTAGWAAQSAVVTVTAGALQRLTRDELQGLVAHEFGHIREGDVRINMRLAGMVWGLEMLYRMGLSMVEPNEGGRRNPMAVPGVVVMAAGWLGHLAGRLLQAAFTRSRDGIGNVLRKAEQDIAAGQGLKADIGSNLQQLLLVSSLPASWMSSHPPLAERIRRIYGRPMPPAAAPAGFKEAR